MRGAAHSYASIPGSGNDYDLSPTARTGARREALDADISAAAGASLVASWFDYTPPAAWTSSEREARGCLVSSADDAARSWLLPMRTPLNGDEEARITVSDISWGLPTGRVGNRLWISWSFASTMGSCTV